VAVGLPSVLAQRALEQGELAVWPPPVLAERAHSEGARSMRAVEGDQTALTRNGWKTTQGRSSPWARGASRRAQGGRVKESAQLKWDRAAAQGTGQSSG